MSNSMNFDTIIPLIYKPFNSWNQFKITTCNGERFIIPYLLSLKKRVSDCQEYFYRFRQVCLPMGHNRSNSVQRSANGHTGHSIFRGRHIEHPILPEPLLQSKRRTEDSFRIGYAQAVTDDGIIDFHNGGRSYIVKLFKGLVAGPL